MTTLIAKEPLMSTEYQPIKRKETSGLINHRFLSMGCLSDEKLWKNGIQVEIIESKETWRGSAVYQNDTAFGSDGFRNWASSYKFLGTKTRQIQFLLAEVCRK